MSKIWEHVLKHVGEKGEITITDCENFQNEKCKIFQKYLRQLRKISGLKVKELETFLGLEPGKWAYMEISNSMKFTEMLAIRSLFLNLNNKLLKKAISILDDSFDKDNSDVELKISYLVNKVSSYYTASVISEMLKQNYYYINNLVTTSNLKEKKILNGTSEIVTYRLSDVLRCFIKHLEMDNNCGKNVVIKSSNRGNCNPVPKGLDVISLKSIMKDGNIRYYSTVKNRVRYHHITVYSCGREKYVERKYHDVLVNRIVCEDRVPIHKNEQMQDEYRTAEFAKMIGVHKLTVYHYIRSGIIKNCRQVGKIWFINKSEFKRFNIVDPNNTTEYTLTENDVIKITNYSESSIRMKLIKRELPFVWVLINGKKERRFRYEDIKKLRDSQDEYRTAEFAKIIGVHKLTVYHYIRSGIIKNCRQVGKIWFINKSEFKRFNITDPNDIAK